MVKKEYLWQDDQMEQSEVKAQSCRVGEVQASAIAKL
jgi:hypothetical protein